jgi:hypothetical protein
MLDSNFTQQRVFVVGEDSLFDQGITHLLAQRTDFLVSRAKFSDGPVFLNAIEQGLPDVILVCDSGSLDAARILDLVSPHAMVRKLHVVVIRLANNVIDIYERPMIVYGKTLINSQQIIAEIKDDLFNAIRRKHNVKRKSTTRIPQE